MKSSQQTCSIVVIHCFRSRVITKSHSIQFQCIVIAGDFAPLPTFDGFHSWLDVLEPQQLNFSSATMIPCRSLPPHPHNKSTLSPILIEASWLVIHACLYVCTINEPICLKKKGVHTELKLWLVLSYGSSGRVTVPSAMMTLSAVSQRTPGMFVPLFQKQYRGGRTIYR